MSVIGTQPDKDFSILTSSQDETNSTYEETTVEMLGNDEHDYPMNHLMINLITMFIVGIIIELVFEKKYIWLSASWVTYCTGLKN